MKEYNKIETLYDRDDKFRVSVGNWRLPEFDYLQGNQWQGTEKIDGTNTRIYFDGQNVIFGGRTENAQMPIFLLNKLQDLFPIEKMAVVYDTCKCPLTLYGEGYGARIQSGGKYIPDGVDFILFDVLVGDWWLNRENLIDVANKLNIKIVPLVFEGNLPEATVAVEKGILSTFGNFFMEGLVLKPKVELRARSGDRIIAKIKTRDFGGE